MANDELELGLDTLGRHNFGNNVIVGVSEIMHVFSKKRMKMKKNNTSITVLRNFYFQVLLVRINIFKGLIATFNVLLHRCIIMLGC